MATQYPRPEEAIFNEGRIADEVSRYRSPFGMSASGEPDDPSSIAGFVSGGGRVMRPGEYVAYAGNAPTSGTVTNIGSLASDVGALGGRAGMLSEGAKAYRRGEGEYPRPNVQALMDIPRAAITGMAVEGAKAAPLSQAQQDFLAGKRQQQKSSPLPTPMEQREIARQREEARMEDQKNWIREFKTMETRAAGEEARKTEGVKIEGRKQIEELKGNIRKDLQREDLQGKERIATLEEIGRQTRAEAEIAMKEGQFDKAAELKRDLAIQGHQAEMERLREQGRFDAAMETQKLVQQASIEAQRSGTDLKRAILNLAGNDWLDPQIKAQLMSVGIDNIIKEGVEGVTPVQTPTAQIPTNQPTQGQPSQQAQSGDIDGDGKVTDADRQMRDGRIRAYEQMILRKTRKDGTPLTPDEISALQQDISDLRKLKFDT